jgi:hypothetical protein
MNGSTWGSGFVVSLETPGVLQIRSSSRFFQVFDWGENKRNVNRFLAHYSPKELRELRDRPNEPAYLDEAGQTPVGRLLSED